MGVAVVIFAYQSYQQERMLDADFELRHGYFSLQSASDANQQAIKTLINRIEADRSLDFETYLQYLRGLAKEVEIEAELIDLDQNDPKAVFAFLDRVSQHYFNARLPEKFISRAERRIRDASVVLPVSSTFDVEHLVFIGEGLIEATYEVPLLLRDYQQTGRIADEFGSAVWSEFIKWQVAVNEPNPCFQLQEPLTRISAGILKDLSRCRALVPGVLAQSLGESVSYNNEEMLVIKQDDEQLLVQLRRFVSEVEPLVVVDHEPWLAGGFWQKRSLDHGKQKVDSVFRFLEVNDIAESSPLSDFALKWLEQSLLIHLSEGLFVPDSTLVTVELNQQEAELSARVKHFESTYRAVLTLTRQLRMLGLSQLGQKIRSQTEAQAMTLLDEIDSTWHETYRVIALTPESKVVSPSQLQDYGTSLIDRIRVIAAYAQSPVNYLLESESLSHHQRFQFWESTLLDLQAYDLSNPASLPSQVQTLLEGAGQAEACSHSQTSRQGAFAIVYEDVRDSICLQPN